MIRFRASIPATGHVVIGIGITKADIQKMLAGESVTIDMAQLRLGEGTIVIGAGETDIQIAKDLQTKFGSLGNVHVNEKPDIVL